jgi:response regulator RpfG family c-di-GMP phosphodiesterase
MEMLPSAAICEGFGSVMNNRLGQMTLFQDTGGDPRASAARLADVLAVYGAIGDAACGNPPGFALRKAATAVSLAKTAGSEADECDAIYFAGLLHAIGAIGNPAYRKGERLSERLARMESWDTPAMGARICEELAPLPRPTADLVRWQAECWDGTGYPDQLRWHGIPQGAMILGLADAFCRTADPDETLGAVGMQSGRAFSPEIARAFTMWFHTSGGEADSVEAPIHKLVNVTPETVTSLIDAIADRVDAHNGVDGRWRRVERLAQHAGTILALDATAATNLSIAVRFYGSGEIAEDELSEASFDPLARLGIDDRAAHAAAAASLISGNPTLGGAAPVLRARSEWYDGTGKPDGLLHSAIPAAAAILAAAIAYDHLDHKDRVDTASGTQFDPRAVRAVLEAARTRA